MPRLNRLIPSMYQRRLLLLALACFIVLLLPLAQFTRLTVVKGDVLRAEAEKKLVNDQWLPTIRGQILDRKGRVLALDRPSFEIAFDYPIITGRWADAQAARKARKIHSARWGELSVEQRDALTRECLPEFEQKLDLMWDRVCAMASISRADLDERRIEVRQQVETLAVTVTERQRQRLENELAKLSETAIDVRTADVRRPVREEAAAHVLIRDVAEDVGFAFRRIAAEDEASDKPKVEWTMPGLHVRDAGRRDYPLETLSVEVDRTSFPSPIRSTAPTTIAVPGVATHALGWIRNSIYETDPIRRATVRGDDPKLPPPRSDRGRYMAGDSAGAAGIEYAAEFELRGQRGVRTRHLDTGEEEVIAPDRGRDIHLTLDAFLQARLQALFDPSLGLTIVQPWHKRKDAPEPEPDKPRDVPLTTPLHGAIAVIDVDTGDILSLVSMPSFTRESLRRSPAAIFQDKVNRPYSNRATTVPYAPGSIVKPLILCSAVTSHKLGIDDRIECTGHFFPDKPLLYRCWVYKQFGGRTHQDEFGHSPNGAEAIQGSCNIFFFELGRRLGPAGIFDWYTRFGVGPKAHRWNLGLGAEYAGSLPEPAAMTPQEAILMGIGQGPIAWTPLHACDAYATIARGGVRIVPHLRTDVPADSTNLSLDQASVRLALEGLRASVEKDHGTTHRLSGLMPDGTKFGEAIFNAPGITVWGKSGTADVAPFKADLDEDGQPDVYDGDHAWCVCLAGVGEKPQYAIAVVIDHGGSGGRVAGPVANQVIHALIAEDYLPKLAPAESEKGKGEQAKAHEPSPATTTPPASTAVSLPRSS